MANYVVTNYETVMCNTVTEAQDLLETYIQSVVNTQVIVSWQIVNVGNGFVGTVVHRDAI
jgi:hypothetical protein